MFTDFLNPFAEWLSHTELSHFVKAKTWVWPLCETIHFIGLSFLVGTIGALDLRMLGVAKQLPVAPLHRLVPWGIAGFLANLITGALFYAGDPLQYTHNIAFQWKMIFVAAAGLNILVFYVGGIYNKIEKVGSGESAPFSAKVVSILSLTLWFGVMYWGRMLPFIGTAF